MASGKNIQGIIMTQWTKCLKSRQKPENKHYHTPFVKHLKHVKTHTLGSSYQSRNFKKNENWIFLGIFSNLDSVYPSQNREVDMIELFFQKEPKSVPPLVSAI